MKAQKVAEDRHQEHHSRKTTPCMKTRYIENKKAIVVNDKRKREMVGPKKPGKAVDNPYPRNMSP